MPKQASPPTPHRVQHAGLVQLAQRTQKAVQWNRILRGSAEWKWLENERSFSIYTKEGRSKQFGVLAIGVVQGSVAEIASLLVASSPDQYVRSMEAVFGNHFKHGTYVQDIISDSPGEKLSVRTATFEKVGGWKPSIDEWQYLEASSYDRERRILEKQMTTLEPQDLAAMDPDSVNANSSRSSKTKQLHDVTVAFRVEPDDTFETNGVPLGMEDPRMTANSGADKKPRVATRVHFYADYAAGSSSLRSRFSRLSITHSSDKRIKRQLVHMAKTCNRLSLLVLRRRLGMQVMVDQKHFLNMATSTCFCCERRLGMLAKLCRMCGHGVCSDCSAKYERETHAHPTRGGRVRLESVRVCDPCLARVDSADYSNITDAALAGPGVLPNADDAPAPGADLKSLLHEALLQAPSSTKKDAVMSVIRCVLDQERASEDTSAGSPRSQLSRTQLLPTPVHDEDYVHALGNLDIKPVPHTEAVLANENGRAYAMDTQTGDVDRPMSYPVPVNEQERIAAIEKSQILGHGAYAELDIICDIAAKELGSAMSLVSIVGADKEHVIGANLDKYRDMVIEREDTFCAHTIMNNTPLEVPHPAADIRFSKMMPVTDMGAKYYCGFPLIADDEHGSVIGALCLIDNKANAMNESQYAVLQKLAATASKVVRLEGAKRRGTVSTQ